MALTVVSPSLPSYGSKHSTSANEESSTSFKFASEDIIVNIFSRLEEDPRHLARLACVCQRFLHVVRNVCWKRHCARLVPELLPSPRAHLDVMAPPPGGWGGLMKLLVCCPGLKHAGVLLDCWDFGLDRELGSSAKYSPPNNEYRRKGKRRVTGSQGEGSGEVEAFRADVVLSRRIDLDGTVDLAHQKDECLEDKVEKARTVMEVDSCKETDEGSRLSCPSFGEITRPLDLKEVVENGILAKSKQSHSSWVTDEVGTVEEMGQTSSRKRKEISGDTRQVNSTMRELSPCLAVNFNLYDKSCSYTYKVKMQESMRNSRELARQVAGPLVTLGDHLCVRQASLGVNSRTGKASHEGEQQSVIKEGDCECKPLELHLASGIRSLSREQGNKLLASRFRADCLYICEWPGCEHPGEKRKYKLFRGIFKNFKASYVWRNLKDMKSRPIDVPCAFCNSSSSWDMMTAFCLRRSFEYHDDGEPVVRAYVCENGHVSGAWTDRPMYTV